LVSTLALLIGSVPLGTIGVIAAAISFGILLGTLVASS
jgi:hypothetical protein